MKWYLKVLKQYADFSGRSRRKEYWMFVLFNMLFTIVAIFIDNYFRWTIGVIPYGVITCLYSIIVLVPGLAVAVRRLHDTGKSGWMLLLGLIPIIGGIWLLVLMVTDGNPQENKYGTNPKVIDDFDQVRSLKNISNALIITYVLAIIPLFFFALDMSSRSSDLSYLDAIGLTFRRLWWIIPVGMIVCGILFRPQYYKKEITPIALIVVSIIWLLITILTIVRIPSNVPVNFQMIDLMMAIVASVALLFLGISLFKEKNTATIPAILLIIACVVRVVFLVYYGTLSVRAINSNFPEYGNFVMFYFEQLGVASEAALIVFATFFFPKKSGLKV